jgi:hypothetical protein
MDGEKTLSDFEFTNKIQDWVFKTGGTKGRSISDAALHFMKTPQQIVDAVKDGYWMVFFLSEKGCLDEDEPMPDNPDWSKIFIELDGE